MRGIVKSIWVLCLLLSSCLIAQAGEPFPCRFDSYFAGELESAEDRPEGYHIELLAGGTAWSTSSRSLPRNMKTQHNSFKSAASKHATGRQHFYWTTIQFADSRPCSEMKLSVKSHRRDGDRYILSVCTDETLNCYMLLD